MRGSLFTRDEILLCTYAARFDEKDFGGVDVIRQLQRRTRASVTAKIQNIAAMLDEEGIPRENRIAPLTGRPAGGSGRRTNWEWVEPVVTLPRTELLNQCRVVLRANENRA